MSIQVLFVCHGNICRSPMAEFVFHHKVAECGLSAQFQIASAATSREEIGNPVHPGTQTKLRERHIPMWPHQAVQMKRSDYDAYDLLIGMDDWNLRNMLRIVGSDPEGKLHKLLDFTDRGGDIADPWYTGNFDVTYRDIDEGCDGLLRAIFAKGWVNK